MCSWISRKAGYGAHVGAERLACAALWRTVQADRGAGNQGEGAGEDSQSDRLRMEKLAKSAKESEAHPSLVKMAKDLLALNKEHDAEDLSAEDKARIDHVRLTGLGVCSRCHWQSGCLDCDPKKLRRYLLNKLRLELGLPPKAARILQFHSSLEAWGVCDDGLLLTSNHQLLGHRICSA